MGGQVIVAEQASGGVEVLVGAVRDPDYGATVVVGLGGGLAEALDLVTASLAPLDDDGAVRLIESLPVLRRLLPDPLPQGLIEAVVAVSRIAAEHPEIAEIDVNPLLVSAERAVALGLSDRDRPSRGELMSEPVCLYEKRGSAAWITLNRPEKLNALNGDVLKLLHEYLRRRGGR